MRLLFYLVAIILLATGSCKQQGDNVLGEIKQISEQINRAEIGDTLDLNLSSISFDKVIILSHEVNWARLKKEVFKTVDNDLALNLKYGNWAFAWMNKYSVVAKVEFSPEKILLDKIVAGDGYKVIKKRDLKRMLVINSLDNNFLNLDKSVREIQLID